MNKQKLIELRCKAWGITEDEYYCNQCSDFSLEDMARAYRRGKNKGARDKAIQNVGFYQKQMQDIYDKKNKQIADLDMTVGTLRTFSNEQATNIENLQKENAELKLKLKALEGQTPWKDIKDKSEVVGQLTTAKEIIKILLHKLIMAKAPYKTDFTENEIAEIKKLIGDSEVEK
jgi:hypothetical protein